MLRAQTSSVRVLELSSRYGACPFGSGFGVYRVQDLTYIGFKAVNSKSKRMFPLISGSLFVGPHGEDLVFWALYSGPLCMETTKS